jgi:hypothetical protein
MNCLFCGTGGSNWQKHSQGEDVFRLQCEKCGAVGFAETAYTSKLGALTADDKVLLAKYFHENKGKVPLITASNFDEILAEQRAKRDAERLRTELDK